jgi:hypothetical protein
MSELSAELQALLDRATRVEEQHGLEAKDDAPVDTMTPDVVMSLATQAVEDAPAVEALQAEVAALRDTLEAFTASSEPGADPAADADAGDFDPDADDAPEVGMDYDEPDDAPGALADGGLVEGAAGEFDPTLLPEGKALGWQPCSACGSTAADEYADGTARCEDCGAPLTGSETKGVDFDEDELDGVLEVIDAPLEAKADTVALTEMELLQARRVALEQ